MPTKSIIEEAVARLAEKKADEFFEQFDTIKAHLQKVWDAEKPKFEDAVANDVHVDGQYRFSLDLSELGSIDKTQAEAVLQTLPSFEPVRYWIEVRDGDDTANPQKFEVVIRFGYQRERAIKDVMNERIEKRRREERQKEREAEREAEAKKARNEAIDKEKEMEELLMPAEICDKMPPEGQAIFESALAGLGYNVDPGEIGSLSEGWKRALRNEFTHSAIEAFKNATIEACEKCHQEVPAIAEAVKAARAAVAQ